jgi:uncharacterized protein with GYD domain
MGFGNLPAGRGEDQEKDMTTFITQARFTKDGLSGMIAAPEDRAEIVGRLIAQVGGKLIAYYLTSGEYDILLIFEGPSYGDTVPALIVAAADSGVADLKTVTALTSGEMKSAFVKAGSIAASYRSAVARAAGSSSAEPQTDHSNPGSQREGETAREAQGNVKAATAILDAERYTSGTSSALLLRSAYVGSCYVSALDRQRGCCKQTNVPNEGPAKRSMNYAELV